ncbi:hypothetical protein [Prevotella dentasini]|uniref:hypothetical protein n=1 Tax=Prevotella dentasini TaxID=589537 RepID=UPI000469468E|nr:hypothetical protein [Prevotella dentasini]
MIDRLKQIFRSKMQLADLDAAANQRLVANALSALNCQGEWHKEKDSHIVRYDFQGGHFNIHIQPSTHYVFLSFLYIAEAKLVNLNGVRTLCNHFNLSSDGPRFCYSINEESDVIDIHLMINLLLDEDRAQEILSSAMSSLFGWQNVFVRKLKETEDELEKTNGKDTEQLNRQLTRELYLIREQELAHQLVAPNWRSNQTQPATLAQWMDTAFGMKDFIPSQLQTITDEISIIKVREDIRNLDFSSLLIAGQDFVRKEATLNLTFFLPSEPDVRRYMTFHLQQAQGGEDVLFYRVSALLLPQSVSPNHQMTSMETRSSTCSALIGYDLQPEKQRKDEFTYIWKEARAKLAEGKFKDMTEEERLISSIIVRNTAYDVFWGRRLYQTGRYYEALLWLENAFRYYRAGFTSLNSDSHEDFFEVCYMIGFCYNELGEYVRAHYYLSLTVGLNRITYAEEYINCLCNMSDFRALAYVDSIINELERTKGENDDEEEDVPLEPHLQSFLSFVRRRKAYILIDMHRYKEAESLLKSLLNDPNSSGFAQKELEYLKGLMKDNS